MENPNKGSLTAVATAFLRAYHATRDTPLIFDDAVARELFTDEEFGLIGRNMAQCLGIFEPEAAAAGLGEAEALDRVMRHQLSTVLCRARYAEECLEEAVASGTGQYVILGAGMDTYAFRRPDMAGRLRVFEVDHPATQGFKRERLARLGWPVPEHLHFAPCDFTRETAADALARTAYAAGRPAFFSWLGVSYYLPGEAFWGTLRALAAHAGSGSAVVFDYFDAEAFDPEKAHPRMRAMQALVRNCGEPMRTGFDPGGLAEGLEAAGFRLVEDLGPEALDGRYFQGRADGLRPYAHVRLARAVVA